MSTAFITTIFNPAGYKNKLTNYKKFRHGLEERGINNNLFTLELAFGDQPFAIPNGKNIFQFRTDSILWQKESLLNLALERLPPRYDSIAWLDADIIFSSPGNVVRQISKKLEDHPVIQLFSTYVHSRYHNGKSYHCWAKYPGKAHPGFGWAARRELLDQIGFYNATPLIGADYLMAIAFSGIKNDNYLHHLNYPSLKHFFEWANKTWPLVQGNVGYIDQHIVHLWHGNFKDRNYFPCLKYLVEEKFSPFEDIKIDANGLLAWNSNKPILHSKVENYFYKRNEENTKNLKSAIKRRVNKKMRVGFVLQSFTFGGHETETMNLIKYANDKLQFTGLAVRMPLPLPPELDENFPPIYGTNTWKESDEKFKTHCQIICDQSDIIIAWGVDDLSRFLPKNRPTIVSVSKGNCPWSTNFCRKNALMIPHLAANSIKAGEAFQSFYQDKIRIIHDGFDPGRVVPQLTRQEQREAWGIDENAKVVGYIGRIAKDKGLQKTIEGLQLLPDWCFAIVGSCSNHIKHEQEIEQICEEKIPGRYKILPWTTDPGSALNAFDVFCHPSDYEGFSNSLAEAWIVGVPTIFTENTGAIPELEETYGPMGISVSLNPSPHEIAMAITKAMEFDVSFPKQVIETFTLDKHVKKWVDYLYEIAGQPTKTRVMCVVDNLIGTNAAWMAKFQNQKEIELALIAIVGQQEWVEPDLNLPFPRQFVQLDELESKIAIHDINLILALDVDLPPADKHPPIIKIKNRTEIEAVTESEERLSPEVRKAIEAILAKGG